MAGLAAQLSTQKRLPFLHWDSRLRGCIGNLQLGCQPFQPFQRNQVLAFRYPDLHWCTAVPAIDRNRCSPLLAILGQPVNLSSTLKQQTCNLQTGSRKCHLRNPIQDWVRFSFATQCEAWSPCFLVIFEDWQQPHGPDSWKNNCLHVWSRHNCELNNQHTQMDCLRPKRPNQDPLPSVQGIRGADRHAWPGCTMMSFVRSLENQGGGQLVQLQIFRKVTLLLDPQFLRNYHTFEAWSASPKSFQMRRGPSPMEESHSLMQAKPQVKPWPADCSKTSQAKD